MIDDKKIIAEFRTAVRLLDMQRRAVVEARAEQGVVDALGAIIQHLHSLSEAQVLRLGSGKHQREFAKSRKLDAANKASTMTLSDVEQALNDESVTRLQLEAIAVGRFQVPSGSLRSLRNIELLRDKIAILTQNERAHETINSVAKESKY